MTARALPRTLDDLRGRRAARWIRESTAGQADNFGPDAQLEQQSRAIERWGLVDTGGAWQVAHSGRTIAATGQWAEMLAGAGEDWDVLVVGYVSRFARDLRTAVNARHDLHARGAVILFADERVLSSDEDEWERWAREAVEAEAYSRRLAKRIREGYAAKRRRLGVPGGNRAPLGTIRDGRTIVVDEAALAIVRRAYELAAGGRTDREVGLASGLAPTHVADVLTNPFYAGRLRTGEQSALGPLVDLGTWEHVQVMRARYSRRHKGAINRRQYGLAGLLACASCGRRLTGHVGRYRHLDACEPFKAAAPRRHRRNATTNLDHRVRGESYKADVYEDAIGRAFEYVAVSTRLKTDAVALAKRPDLDGGDDLAKARINRERERAALRFAKDRDLGRREATMARLDAEAAAAVVRPSRIPTAAEAREYLESLPDLWAKTSDAGRHAIAEAVFERIDVLGAGCPGRRAAACGLSPSRGSPAPSWSGSSWTSALATPSPASSSATRATRWSDTWDSRSPTSRSTRSPNSSPRSCTRTPSRAMSRTPARRTSPTWSGSCSAMRSRATRSSRPRPPPSRDARRTPGRRCPQSRLRHGPASTRRSGRRWRSSPRRPMRRTTSWWRSWSLCSRAHVAWDGILPPGPGDHDRVPHASRDLGLVAFRAVKDLLGRVTPEALRLRAGDRTYRRGRDYADAGRVSAIAEDGSVLTGVVEGTLDYEVVLELEGDDLVGTCHCPKGETGAFCKHMVALGLAWLAQAGEPADPGPHAPVRGGPRPTRITTEDVRNHLAAMDHGALVDLVLAQAERDDLLRERLLLLVATAEAAGAGADLVRRAIDKAIRVPGYLRSADMHGYVSGIHGAIDLLEDMLRTGQAEVVIELAEHALRRVEGAMDHVDDSDGEMGDVLGWLGDLHLAACEVTRPDPVVLAGRLFAWELDGEWDVFSGAALTYADVLGEAGIAEYRRLAEADWATVPQLGPEAGVGRSFDGRRYRITSMMESLARAVGDVDELLAVKARDLSSPYAHLEIARVFLDAGRANEALDWAEQGVRAFPATSDGRLRAFLADRYHERSRDDDAIALGWAPFEARPTIEGFAALKAHASRAGVWPAWRERAIECM